MTFLHATDLRQVPFILTHGLFSGVGRAPLAISDEKGQAYTRQIVVRQLRKGWEVEDLAMILPQGPGIARAFREWHREEKLVWLPPSHLDRSATLRVNEALVGGGLLPEPTFAGLKGILRHEP
jgi:hypothetical protein